MKIWIREADEIDFDKNLENILYGENKSVKKSLEQNTLGICAPKGIGKTFLLKVKRKRVQETGARCLPDNAMVDNINAFDINHQLNSFLSEFKNWVQIWEYALAISIIKSSGFDFFKDKSIYDDLKKETKFLLNNPIYNRTLQIMSYLLSREKKELTAMLFDRSNLLCFVDSDKVHSSLCIFIDKVDQAMSNQSIDYRFNRDFEEDVMFTNFWKYSQYALHIAACNFYSLNNHIKIYFSIRPEVFINSSDLSPLSLQYRGYTCDLNYNKNDIQRIYETYIMNESDNQLSHPKSSGYSYSKLFLGVDQIAHNYILGLSEDIFDYIYRHTQGRPRDIMHICDSLTRLIRTNYNENDFRRLVNESALTILETYLTESRESIHDIDFDQTLNLFTFFKSNILKFSDIERACKHFNETNELISQCNGNCKNCVGTHIISKLYNLGLIGVISRRDYKNIITYSDINRRVFDVDRTIIPISEYYFLHPSVAYYSRRANLERGLEFRNSKITVVANNIEITEYNMFLIEEEMGEKTSREGVFLASTHEDLRDIRSAISDYFEKIGKKITVVENTLSTENINQVHVQDHCLNLVKMSEKIIYVLAKNYGNTYVADKYKRLHNQFVEDSKIQHVSMPVMELLTAFHFNLKHEIYVDERLMFERECYNKNRHLDYIPHFADSNNVFEFLNYLSLKGINLIRFKDLEELKKLVFSNNKQIMV